MATSCWTDDQRKLIAKLVRRIKPMPSVAGRESNAVMFKGQYGPRDRLLLCRGASGSAQVTQARRLLDGWLHAFDFDAASEAFQEHLRGEGVDFSPAETSSTSLRKAFASLGRTPSTRTDGCSPPRRRYEPAQLIRTSGDGYKDGSNLEGTRCSPNNDLDVDHANIKKKSIWKRVGLNKSALDTHGTHSSQSAEGESNRSPQPKAALRVVEPEQDQLAKGTEPFGLRGIEETPPDSSWTFEAMLKEQRRKEVQHEAQKERTFQRVLSALGGPTGDAADLPPNVVSAWEARNEKLVTEAENTKLRQQKLKDNRDLVLQREALMQRHLPGSEDNVGEDPLATSLAQLALPPAHSAFDSAGPVRLELGMDAEMLDKILDELDEESTAAGGYRETNSELSRILDVLDKAAGDVPVAATLLADAQGGRQ